MEKDTEFLKNIRGAVFDLDGTILDSAWVWDRVDIEFLGKRGFAEIYLEDHVPEKSEEEFKQAVKTLRNCKITGWNKRDRDEVIFD